MLSILIGVLIICVVGAICFWAIENFVKQSFGESTQNPRGADLRGGDPTASASAGGN
jgi:hypothetical protein